VRIGIDIRKPDWSEGQQRYLWRMGCWFADQGHSVHFLNALPDSESPTLPTGVSYHGLGEVSRKDLRKRVAALELDVLVLNPEKSRRYGGVAANVLRPGYGTEHYSQKMDSFRHPISRALRTALRVTPPVLIAKRRERRFYQREGTPPEVIAMSGLLEDAVSLSYGVPAGQIHRISNCVDRTRFSPERREEIRAAQRARWDVPDDALCLLFMGHNFRLKGLWGLIEVVAALRDQGISTRLIAAGKGTGPSQWRQAKRVIRRHGCESIVRLTGPIRPAIEAFAAADVLLHPSWHDAFGNVVLEAMACGLPVVTTPRIGAAEIIAPGESGLLVEPDDLWGMTQAVAQLADRPTRERVGAAALRVAAAHGEESNFPQVLAVLERAAERAHGTVT